MGNFISLLLILEASKSRARGTDGCIQCSGTPSLACPHHCPHLRGSGDGGHGSVCGPGCWMCKQVHARAGLTFRFRHFSIFQDMRIFVLCLLTIFRKHMLGLSLFPLVLYSFKPQEVHILTGTVHFGDFSLSLCVTIPKEEYLIYEIWPGDHHA